MPRVPMQPKHGDCALWYVPSSFALPTGVLELTTFWWKLMGSILNPQSPPGFLCGASEGLGQAFQGNSRTESEGRGYVRCNVSVT